MPSVKFLQFRLNTDTPEGAEIDASISRLAPGERSRVFRAAMLAYFRGSGAVPRPSQPKSKPVPTQKPAASPATVPTQAEEKMEMKTAAHDEAQGQSNDTEAHQNYFKSLLR